MSLPSTCSLVSRPRHGLRGGFRAAPQRDLLMTRDGLRHARVGAEEARRPRSRVEPLATPVVSQRNIAQILASLERK